MHSAANSANNPTFPPVLINRQNSRLYDKFIIFGTEFQSLNTMKQTIPTFSAILLLLLLSCSGNEPDEQTNFKIPELTTDNTVQFTTNAPGKLFCEVYAGGTKVAIDWGDGTLDKLTIPYNEVCRHTYKKQGNYRVKIWSDHLTFLNVSAQGLPYTALSIGYCPELTNMMINGFDDVIHLALDNCPKLESLNIGNCQHLESLDISKCTNLKTLACYSHPKLNCLDISNNKQLEMLDISYMPVTSLDLSPNINLQQLYCPMNKLTILDLSNNPALVEVVCEYNELTEIILQDNTGIEKFYCSSNQLQAGELNKIFTALPESKIKAATTKTSPSSPQPNTIQYSNNPGADECDNKIMINKGWLVSDGDIGV
jgi:hypothetical protein